LGYRRNCHKATYTHTHTPLLMITMSLDKLVWVHTACSFFTGTFIVGFWVAAWFLAWVMGF
jgi:hypothetical protein